MSATSSSLDRRGFLASSAAVGAATLLPAAARAGAEGDAIRPFRIDVPEGYSSTSGAASSRRGGRTRRPSAIDPKALSWRACRSWSASRDFVFNRYSP